MKMSLFLTMALSLAALVQPAQAQIYLDGYSAQHSWPNSYDQYDRFGQNYVSPGHGGRAYAASHPAVAAQGYATDGGYYGNAGGHVVRGASYPGNHSSGGGFGRYSGHRQTRGIYLNLFGH